MTLNLDEVKCRNDHDPVVMVDDSETDLDIAQRVYGRSKLENPFVTFFDGSSFLDYMESVRMGHRPMPALVLMDVNMPMLNGFETIETLREEEAFSSIPVVVMLTNSDNPADSQKAMAVGANGFQTKYSDIKAYTAFFDSFKPEPPLSPAEA